MDFTNFAKLWPLLKWGSLALALVLVGLGLYMGAKL